jgi:hypothetical protein
MRKAPIIQIIVLTLLIHCVTSQAFAADVYVKGIQSPGELVCPHARDRAGPTVPRQQQVEPLEVPSRDELRAISEDLLQTLPPSPRETQQKINLNSIAFWGDSHIAADFFIDGLIAALNIQRSDVRPRSIPPTMTRGGVRLPLRKFCISDGWKIQTALSARSAITNPGPGLARLENRENDQDIWIDFRPKDSEARLTRLTISFSRIDEIPVEIQVSVDGEPSQQIELGQGQTELVLHGTQAFSILKLRVLQGKLALKNFQPTYLETPKLHLDVYGLPGATIRGWQDIDPDTFSKNFSDVNYDLVVLEYGTNEAANKNFDAPSYQSMLSNALRNLKTVFPSSKCLLIGPPDRGVLISPRKPIQSTRPGNRKKVASQQPRRIDTSELFKYSVIHSRIADIQKQQAAAFGCQFWDWQAAMGGQGGAYKWFYHSPPLMAKDLIHLTKDGYLESGKRFARTMGLSHSVR